MRTKVKLVLEGMKCFAQQALEDREKYLTSVKDFTRQRKLDFNKLCLFLLVQGRCSLAIELDRFFGQCGELPCKKSSFSKARYRVLWVFFQDWLLHCVRLIYAQKRGLHRWKGFYLKAVDGTTLYLFKDPEMEATFGGQSNQHGCAPLARAGIEVDVLNGYCTQARLQPWSEGETVFADVFLKTSSKQDLKVYDRYFVGFELIFKHLQAETNFLMRCSLTFNNVVKKFVASGKKQAIVDFPITAHALASLQSQGCQVDKSTTVRVRLLRIDIGGEEPEILVTSLLDLRKYPRQAFKEVYGLRWGSETKIDQLKNKLQIEIFSGLKPAAIYQDFYATIIASNLHNLICEECQEDLEEINQTRQIPAAINQNVSIGLLKPRLLELFQTKRPRAIFEEIKNLFLAHLEPVRPGRKYPRTKASRKNKGKYQTFKNYKRAT